MWEDRDFANYIVGQADADSAFCVEVYEHKRYSFGVRVWVYWTISKAFDENILKRITDFLGVGKVRYVKARKPLPDYELRVYGKECSKIVEFFEKFPLRANKQKDFELWKEAVEICNSRKRSHGNPWKKEELLKVLVIRQQLTHLWTRGKRHGRDISNLIEKLKAN